LTARQLFAEFATETSLREAVRAARVLGLTVSEVHSPYPLGSQDGLTSDDRSFVAPAALAGGVLGASSGLGLQVWTGAVSWPLDVGGKDLLPWLAFIPVTFELTMLGATVAAVTALLLELRAGRPALPDEFRGTDPRQRFVLVLTSCGAEPLGSVHGLMRALGSSRTLEESINDPETRDRTRAATERWSAWNRILRLVALMSMSLAGVLWSTAPSRVPPVAVANQLADGDTGRPAIPTGPAPGTVPREYLPIRYEPTEADALRAGVELMMPVALRAEDAPQPAVLFRTFCQPCHGADGHGDGLTMKRGFQPPASLLTQRARDMKDGQMFHVITYGQKLMPSHAVQLPVADRWRLVRHIRDLQERLPIDPPPFGEATATGGAAPQ
jgi:mono/diheme cytochrome c family protein